jgi:hypothetical protein
MRKNLLVLLFLSCVFFSNAQFVGINTTTPQASLDVKGTERIGGINNYVKYDSATGRIEWNGASIWAPVSQQIIKHSASAEGLYAGSGKLDYRNSSGIPVFFSEWATGNGYFSGNLGIGTVSPTAKFQIRDGASGITPFFSARVVVETNSHTYINLLSPDPFETGILFGSGTNAVSGLISYNSTTVPKGFIFSNNGNQTRMVINNAGNVGIGVTDPQQTLSIKAGMNIDQTNLNHGTLDNNVLRFGSSSGEAIGSGRVSGDNVYGLDFYAGGLKRMVIANGGNVGIGTTTPQYPLDINGRMRLSGTNPNDPGIWLNDASVDRAFIGLQNNNHVGFYGNGGIAWGFTMNTLTGALALNSNEGQAGQVITALGVGQPASWLNPLNQLYNNMTEYAELSTTTLGPLTNTNVAGMSGIVLNISTRSKVIFSAGMDITSNPCFSCVGSDARIVIQIDPGGPIIDGGFAESNIASGENHTLVTGDRIKTLNPGNYTINTILGNENVSGPSITGSNGRLNIIIIRE